MKVYYDTTAFAHFFLTNDGNHPYSPFTKKFICITSPFTLEEFLFNFITRGKFANVFKNSINDRVGKVADLVQFMAFFKVDPIDLDDLTSLFLSMVIRGLEKNILKTSTNNDGLDFYDCLHLSFALLADAVTLITCDKDFEKLTLIRDFISAFKLRKIEIFEPDPNFDNKVRSIIF